MKSIREFWEERSKKYGKKPEGVLPKSFPRFVNDFLDRWMYLQIKHEIRISKFETGKFEILDLGCGYGRLSKKILEDFPKAQTVGVDISQTYVDLYNRDLAPRGKAVRGDIRRLPFKDASFDTSVMVTTLMYITDKKGQQRAMKEMFRVLRPGGRFVVIERNPRAYSLLMLGGLVEKIRGPKKREIPAVSFNPGYMQSLIRKSGGAVEKTEGIPPLLTISLYISYSGSKKL